MEDTDLFFVNGGMRSRRRFLLLELLHEDFIRYLGLFELCLQLSDLLGVARFLSSHLDNLLTRPSRRAGRHTL